MSLAKEKNARNEKNIAQYRSLLVSDENNHNVIQGGKKLMGLQETVKRMRELLAGISVDLEKAAGGNKAASQRVRTGTIKLEKIAKNYRKESIHAEKSGAVKKSSSKKAHAKAKPKAAKVKAKPKAKALQNPARRHAMMMKRPTAKIPVKKA